MSEINENAKKWVAALRSGEYKQTQEILQNIYGFCCLGVACSVYEKETGTNLKKRSSGTIYGTDLSEQPSVMEWLDIRSDCGHFIGGNLVNLNDSKGYNFNQLADIIESNPEGLFND